MNGPFFAGTTPGAGGRIRRVGRKRRKIARCVALLLFLATLLSMGTASIADDASEVRSFERRAVAEQTSRSRFRRLEVASLVVILVCGGAVTLWVIRRR